MLGLDQTCTLTSHTCDHAFLIHVLKHVRNIPHAEARAYVKHRLTRANDVANTATLFTLTLNHIPTRQHCASGLLNMFALHVTLTNLATKSKPLTLTLNPVSRTTLDQQAVEYVESSQPHELKSLPLQQLIMIEIRQRHFIRKTPQVLTHPEKHRAVSGTLLLTHPEKHQAVSGTFLLQGLFPT